MGVPYKLKEAIMVILFRWDDEGECGWWYGYSRLRDELMENFAFAGSVKDVKKEMKALLEDGEVKRDFCWNEGMLSGSGYFVNNKQVTTASEHLGV